MDKIDWKEARRYLGLKGEVPELEEKLRQAGELLLSTVRPRGVWRRFSLSRSGKQLSFAGIQTESHALFAHLEGCREVCLLAVTLGVETDRLLERLTLTDAALAVMVQACAAALLESCCDRYEEAIVAEVSAEKLFLRPRFSPGYGDLPLALQAPLLRALEGEKRIGLTVTGGDMLVPTKSVTAVIGLSSDAGVCHAKGCATCNKKDCHFRREA